MKIIFTLFVFFLLFSFSKAQQKYSITDQSGQPANYCISSLRSKVPVFLEIDRQTQSISPFNAIPNDPLGTMAYLVGTAKVSITTLLKKDSLSYYRYSVFENDTTVVKSNALPDKIDFVWPEHSGHPGYLTMNLGVFQVKNKKITLKIYRLPEEGKVTTVIIYNKTLKPAVLTEADLLRGNRVVKIPFIPDTIYREVNDVKPLKNGTPPFNVDQKTLGIYLSMKKTDLDFVYQVVLKNKAEGKENIIFSSNTWVYNRSDENPSVLIPANYFSIPGSYELSIKPIIGSPSDEPIIHPQPVSISFRVTKPPLAFSTGEVIKGLLIFLLFTAFAFFLIRRKNRQKLQIANRQADAAKTELNHVRSQLNPHFVFNALSGIQNLMNQHEIEKANAYLSKFARLTRNILDGKQLIALKDEYRLLDDYLAMEKLRFNFNYEIRLNLEIDLLEVMIPAMLLQPFAENAVKHSMSILGDKGDLLVEFRSRNKDLILSVHDNGTGFHVENPQEGFGLPLSKKRIDLLNQMYRECPVILDLHSDQKGTIVVITLNNWL